MYVRDLVAGILRQWPVLVAGLILTVAAAVGAYIVSPVSYQASASLVLLPPPAVTEGANPYLHLDGLNQALEVMSQRMSSDDQQQTLAKDYPGASYTAGPDPTTSGPILTITTSAASSSAALGLLDRLQSLAPDTLSQMQTDLRVTSDARIGITGVASDSKAQVTTKARTQLTVIVGAVGFVLTVLVTALIDRARTRRRERRLAAVVAADE